MKRLMSVLIIMICLLALGICFFLRFQQQDQSLSVGGETGDMPATAVPVQDTDVAVPVLVTAAEPETAAPTDYLELYAPVFRTYRLWLEGNQQPDFSNETERGDYYLELGETGISFLCRYVNSLGYALQDMDGNGVPELIIGSSEYADYATTIFDMFTIVDGAPRRVVVSSERGCYYFGPDQRILHSGSGGASYNFCGLYRFADNDIQLEYGVVMDGDTCFEVTRDRENLFDRQPDDQAISRDEYQSKTDEMFAETIVPELISL